MEIRQITEQNPWWEDKKAIEQDEKVKEALAKEDKMKLPYCEGNFLIIGPRQVGKTTYLKLCIKELLEKEVDPRRIVYFSCETLRAFEEIIEIIRFTDSLTAGEKYLFFDEITFVEDWQKAIKYFLDSPLGKNKNLYVSGSSSLALKKETFPGRKIKTRLFLPLSFCQFCQVFGSSNLKKTLTKLKLGEIEVGKINSSAKELFFFFNEISQLFNTFLKAGGFPRSIYELGESGKISAETYEIYWKWLISDIAKIERSERVTSAVLLAVLKNYGSRFSLNSVAKEMEIGSHVTVREYLEILENLFVLRSVFAFDPKKKSEVFRKLRKVYFVDPFLFAALKKMLSQTSVELAEEPKILEGIVAEHLARKLGQIFYLGGKKEVDFGGSSFGIEVKWQKKVSLADFPKVSVKNKVLLSRSDFHFFEKENMVIVPAAVFLAIL